MLALLMVAACEVGDATGDAGPTGPATALFDLTPDEYYALPFPSDLRVRDDGTLDLDGHVRPNVLIGQYLDLISARFDGFGTNQTVFVRFDGAIDPASLPATPADAMADDASVYLVDVDPASPERGTRRPLRFRFEPTEGETIGPGWLACLPYPGFPLRARTTYALVLTRRVHASDGSPVRSSTDLDAVLATDTSTDAAVTRARTVHAPLLSWLDEPGGDERADVAVATVFTTQDPTSLLAKMREVAVALPAPTLANLKPVSQNATFALFEATYDTPIFQSGTHPYLDEGGEILVDANGQPVVQRLEAVRVAIAVPASGAVPAGGWPTVLYAHGTGGDYASFSRDGTAARFTAAGFAVMGIDQAMNGARGTGDGTEELNFYNFQNPLAGRDNSRQGGADNFTLVRLVGTASVPDGQRTHTFAKDRVYFMGHSQGGITGPLAVAFEPGIRGAIFSGAGGLLYYALLLKTEPVDITALLAAFVRDVPLDEFNNVLALVQMFIDPADPVNYAHLIAQDVFQSQGLVDRYTPVPAIEALGVALGGDPVGPLLEPLPGFALAGHAPLAAPVSKNRGQRTVVFRQYRQVGTSDGHFVLFDDPDGRRQHVEFLRSLDQTGTATFVP